MKKRLCNLLTVKSIVTLILTAAFTYLSVTNKIAPEQFLVIFTTIISFYFGTQHEKKGSDNNGSGS